ncbi:MetQ/NlpA family ABC transporter substrate-binding protein [Lachnospiraceae bacterium ZAX-1]
MKRKRSMMAVLALVFALGFAACGAKETADTTGGADVVDDVVADTTDAAVTDTSTVVKVGVVGEIEGVQLWTHIIEDLKAEGVDVELVQFDDYIIPNEALANNEIDLNAFQSYAYLEDQINTYGYDFVSVGDTYISAMCIYSDKITDIKDIPQGAKIAIPNDPVNLGRALSVAQGAGLIKLDTPTGSTNEIANISENTLEITFEPVEASQIPTLLPDFDAGIINGNYAVDFNLDPKNDSIFYDDVSIYPDNRYVNHITARAADKDNETYKKVVAAYQSEKTEAKYDELFQGSYIPAWK